MRSFANLNLLCTLLVLATVSSSWPWVPLENKIFEGVIGKRDGSTSQASNATVTGSAASGTGTSANSTGTQNSTATKHTSSSSIFVDPRLPPGGISLITPAPTTTTYYKIGNYVTFAWNYTSLSVTPSAIDVIASCSLNSATYTIASNMSVKETGAVTWDTNNYQSSTVPLLTASYTLIIYEAGKAITDVAGAGHLGSSSQYIFGMYLPQTYTPLYGGYFCATCSAAMSEIERQALGFMFTMIAITLLSFTWFAGGLGLFS
ncbi:hypothetical protein Egran_00099 [Elaphomyces granulatus]|uniref:DUF7137 domain-containing protein n=1 Tax=Elaphomyces granulatus TaxID=519963 RepID=A0A232M6V6_9EURO|nr:hypothetical protein Egran_00099 [Elaphomyces granulatus]